MWGREIDKWLAEDNGRDNTALREYIRLTSERHVRYVVGEQK